jgi:spoIIIJ-associated protein
MIKEATATGRSVEEALEAACEALGKTREEVEFEILEMPRKGFLGLSLIPAKVKVWIEQAEPAADKPAAITQFITDILKAMGLAEVEVAHTTEDGNLNVNITGDVAGISIGRRGETLDALQYLAGLAANRIEGEYVRVVLDSGNYREKRRKTLEQLAKKLANNAIKTNRSTKLEPMNPYERRVIHSAIAEIEGVTSASVGEEPNRCVVISTTSRAGQRVNSDEKAEAALPAQRQQGYNRPQDNRDGRKKDMSTGREGFSGRDRRGPRREKPPAYKETGLREKPPAEAADKPLYGKIEL